MAFDVDFFVIGAGSGGVRAARIAAGYGAKTVVAEESRIGGTCVIRGCVPKKLYVYASRFADAFADAAGFGWRVGETAFDWPSLVAAKEKEITRLSAAYRHNLAVFGRRADRGARDGRRAAARTAGRRNGDVRAPYSRFDGLAANATPGNRRASSTPSPPTKPSIFPSSPAVYWSSAAATSRSNSPPCFSALDLR